jgi:phage shock protein A
MFKTGVYTEIVNNVHITEMTMIKTFLTLVRGSVAAAEEELVDRSALLILDQQIRDSAAAIERSKRALALAIAQDEAEAKRLESTLQRIADLEERAAAALAAGREDLAGEAAETIAALEADRDAIRAARATFGGEISRLRFAVNNAGRRLTDLERGRRIAQAAEAVRRLKVSAAGQVGSADLADAEATLRRLRERQAEEAAVDAAMQSLDTASAPVGVADKLEAAGFGKRTRPTAADVLERLRQRNAAATPAA